VNTVNNLVDPSNPVAVGAFNNSAFFAGILDEVRVWNVARTQDQIISTMNSELAGTESGLVLNYHFNQGIAGGTNTSITSSSSAQIIDRRTNTETGTLRNFAGTGTVSNIVASTSATRTSVASFTTVAPIATTHQWQVSTDNGSTWTNITAGQIPLLSGVVYT
jgi:hypothetical protein